MTDTTVRIIELKKFKFSDVKKLKRTDTWIAYFSSECTDEERKVIAMTNPAIKEALNYEMLLFGYYFYYYWFKYRTTKRNSKNIVVKKYPENKYISGYFIYFLVIILYFFHFCFRYIQNISNNKYYITKKSI